MVIRATDKSVRDHAQQARIYGEKIEVTSRVGTKLAGRYWFPLQAWQAFNRTPNPVWCKRDFITSLTGQLDNEPGGPDQAERIRDSQIAAIDRAFSQIADV